MGTFPARAVIEPLTSHAGFFAQMPDQADHAAYTLA